VTYTVIAYSFEEVDKPVLANMAPLAGEEASSGSPMRLPQHLLNAPPNQDGGSQTQSGCQGGFVSKDAMNRQAHFLADDLIGDPFAADGTEHR
jgi:hypothetical protein